ncbi:MAG: [FeFe] hydrogenase, group A [Clostridium luticellarii]|uniref:Iron hydrogenase 1 n=2 Tax=Clostridium luticellarii TaxID=1691940 RepID=A0A2T0BME6_9CLOT|nr:[FeFe] hydrogenase, group A [Clostridium luticellarii]MCI2040073.1 [FeFe] hydrogenase, group A [Clostridium luticellarii]PRR84972.1 Iron hydrogenase 1 [Clostridium luticellarii]
MLTGTPIINIDKELCTGCRRCAEVCPVDAIEGEEGKPQSINRDKCIMCGQCVQMCKGYESVYDQVPTPMSKRLFDRGLLEDVDEPLFAAYNTSQVKKIKDILKNRDVFKIVQCAPSVRVALGEDFGMPLGTLSPGKMAAALRKLGFDRVYDTNFGADLTIMEEGSELLRRITEGGVLPMFTSCCPAWVKYVEQAYPELIPHLSTCKSPQQMAGTIFKTYGAQVDKVNPAKMYSVSVMPCTCKEFECEREEMQDSGYRDVDVSITTRELAYLIKDARIDFNSLKEEEFDAPLGTYTGAGTIFGSTGGVMEAALRTGYELYTRKPIPKIDLTMVRGGEGFRVAQVDLGDFRLKVAVVSGLKYVKEVLESVKNGRCHIHFIEVMTCPQGCISGGGQPKIIFEEDKETAYNRRKEGLYIHDSSLAIRKSHENPAIKKVYMDFLEEPLGYKSHELLHTKYRSRKKVVSSAK